MGVKVIYATGQVRRQPDDPSMPFLLEANLSPPKFLEVAFVCMHGGSEEIIIRADTEEEIMQVRNRIGLEDHPRLRRYKITGPKGVVVEKDRNKPKEVDAGCRKEKE